MNNGLEYFINNKDDLIAVKENVITGKKYRFTILSDRLIRIEYNESGIFENRASANVIFRNFFKWFNHFTSPCKLFYHFFLIVAIATLHFFKIML